MISKYRDMHKGKRGFVICNGPSLNEHDLSKLDNEITIGTNRIYLHESFVPKYWTIEDWPLIRGSKEEIINYTEPDEKFISHLFMNFGKGFCYINFVRCVPGQNVFNVVDKDKGTFYWGATVTNLAIQLLYYMGCNPIYIIGADHNWDGDYHFAKGYEKDTDSPHKPENVKVMEQAYQRIDDLLRKNGVDVYNASKNSKLDVFRRADYDKLFE